MRGHAAGRRLLSLLVMVGAMALGVGARPAATPGTWSATGSMNVRRVYQSAQLLPNGTVLVAGGYFFRSTPTLQAVDQATAEIYHPTTHTWTPTGSMAVARHSHTATLLPTTGKVLIAGGCCNTAGNDLASAELYDPATHLFTTTGSMATAREDQVAVPLTNGTVLVAGGGISNNAATATAELYDPTTGTWTPTGSMHVARQGFAAVRLPNGTVLVAGGQGCFQCGATATAELYNPATNTWRFTGSMTTGRFFHTLTYLPATGQVLATGGCVAPCGSVFTNITATAELWSPTTQTWHPTGSMSIARIWHTATLLGTGKVLVAGGESTNRQPVGPAELYDPGTGTWSTTGTLNMARELHTATLLANGQVLVTGGFGPPLSFGSQATNTAELYQP
jgi:hypothetical protein